MRTREVVESEVVVKELGHIGDILGRRCFACCSDLSEELFELFTAYYMGVGPQTRLAQGLLQKLGHVEANAKELPLLFLGRKLVLESRGEEVGKDLDDDGNEKLHKGNDDEDGKGDEAEEVLGCALELAALATGEGVAVKDFPLEPARDDDFGDEELGSVPVVLGLMLDFFPDADTERVLRSRFGGGLWERRVESEWARSGIQERAGREAQQRPRA